MKPIYSFITVPSLPAPLAKLRDLAYDLQWAWNHDAIQLFRQLDTELWETTGHNPVVMLGLIDQRKLKAASADEGFLLQLERVSQAFEAYRASKSTWFGRTHTIAGDKRIAYFSAEFGITECLSIFAGGLGVLAGDHLKSASDLGIPLVGVGLLYQQGYFRQYLNEAGWQQENYVENDFHNLPVVLQRGPDGSAITVELAFPERKVIAQVWRAQVGRVSLYLMDTNVPENTPEDRSITYQLYGGDVEMRIKQEIVLGIGGFRALQALGIDVAVYHMNEGHSAFLSIERIRQLMETKGLSLTEAWEAASAGLVFTTHTPVPAGHDYFSGELMDKYFSEYYDALKVSRETFLSFGRKNLPKPPVVEGETQPVEEEEPFCMTILALKTAAFSNGVSRLHGEVSREMWQCLWPGVPEKEIPIGHITNGVHFLSWISREMKQLYDRYLSPRWRREPAEHSVWQNAEHIATGELWATHERRRERLVAFARRKLRHQLEHCGASQAEIQAADEVLDSKVLTIGFSRRFATYKRATLLLQDPDRLDKIVNNPDRPVQFVFAGKAHPKDEPGKALIQKIVALSKQERFRRRIVFLEDYDMSVARYLVQGSDVWLNNPMRPHEASGTSGMKAAANGVLNLSILDGWWDEAYQPLVGWAIGGREEYDTLEYQNSVEAENLYELLEQEVVPMFYERGVDGLPRRWIASMKACIGHLCHFFNTHRMVQEYTERFYLAAATQFANISANNLEKAKTLAAWMSRVKENWASVKIELAEAGPQKKDLEVGQPFAVRARVALGALTPEDVAVELYLGRVNANEEIVEGYSVPMSFARKESDGTHVYEAANVQCEKSGKHGYTIRVIPRHACLTKPFIPGLIVWA